MRGSKRVLIIDDGVEHVRDLRDIIRTCGGEPVVAINAAEGRAHLAAVAGGEESYALAIIDVMMAITSLEEVRKLEHAVNENAKRIGVTLCREAREQLRISPQTLEIVCFSIRDDADIVDELTALGIRYISKVTQRGWADLREHVKKALS
jgi:CheY-like chemotaxis protein